MSFHHFHHHLAENSWQVNILDIVSFVFKPSNFLQDRSNHPTSSNSTANVDFQPPYFPPPFPNVSHQHSFDQHSYDYTSSPPPSAPLALSSSTTSNQSYNSLVRSSAGNLDETNASLSHPYGAYAEYAASYYSRHAMVLDPESLQLYRNGLLGTDAVNTGTFRVNYSLLLHGHLLI